MYGAQSRMLGLSVAAFVCFRQNPSQMTGLKRSLRAFSVSEVCRNVGESSRKWKGFLPKDRLDEVVLCTRDQVALRLIGHLHR